MLKFNNRNTRKSYEICSKLTINTPKPCNWRCPGVFNVNFEYFSLLVLVFLLLPLNMYLFAGDISIFVRKKHENFETNIQHPTYLLLYMA